MSLLSPWLQGLTGAGYTADSGGQRIDGRRVLETYNPVFAAQGAYTTGVGEGAMDYAAQGPQFNAAVGGAFDEDFANRQGFGDLWRSGYTPGGGFGEDRADAAYSPELLAQLSKYQVAKLGYGDDMRQFAVIDPSTGQVVNATQPRAYRDAFRGEFLPAAAALIGGAAMNGAFAGLGEAGLAEGAGLADGWSSGVTFGAGDAGAAGLSGMSGPGLSNGLGLGGGLGGGAAGGLLGDIGSRASGAIDWLRNNPSLARGIFSLGGGLLGGVGGGGGSAPQETYGPPKQWKSPLQAGLLTPPEQSNFGPVSFKGRW